MIMTNVVENTLLTRNRQIVYHFDRQFQTNLQVDNQISLVAVKENQNIKSAIYSMIREGIYY